MHKVSVDMWLALEREILSRTLLADEVGVFANCTSPLTRPFEPQLLKGPLVVVAYATTCNRGHSRSWPLPSRGEKVHPFNEQNVLVTVLAAQPRHYNAREGRMEAGRPRTHRYYYLHPGRHDCVQTDAEDVLEDNPSIFSCWRPQSSGMWPTDDAISLHSGGGCTRELLVPAFGLAVVMPFVAVVRMLETTLDAVCTLTAVMATHSHNPFQTLQELFTVATYCVMRGTCSNRGHSPTCIHAPVNMVTHYVPASRWGNPSLPSITTVPWPCHAALLLPSQPCTPRQQRYVLECLHSVHGIASVRVENHTVNKLRSSWSGSLPGSGEQQHHHVAR